MYPHHPTYLLVLRLEADTRTSLAPSAFQPPSIPACSPRVDSAFRTPHLISPLILAPCTSVSAFSQIRSSQSEIRNQRSFRNPHFAFLIQNVLSYPRTFVHPWQFRPPRLPELPQGIIHACRPIITKWSITQLREVVQMRPMGFRWQEGTRNVRTPRSERQTQRRSQRGGVPSTQRTYNRCS